MNKNQPIITIGRQTGSNGREIGLRLAKKLGIPFYDRELITEAAKESGLDEKVIENSEEKPIGSLIYSLYMGAVPYGAGTASSGDLPLDQKVFIAQFEAIKRIAAEGPCVIVGRCADYALAGNPALFSIFILADETDRIRVVMDELGFSESKARDYITKRDKKRASYYNFNTDKKWGAASTYDLCLNSSAFGVDGSVELLAAAIEAHRS